MKRPALGHVVAYTVLLVVLSAGTAQSLSGSNTVFSDDIVNGQVGYADIRDRAVGSRKILDGSIGAIDLGANSVTASKLQRQSVTGAAAAATGEESLDFGSLGAGACQSRLLIEEIYSWGNGEPRPGFDTAIVSPRSRDWPTGVTLHTQFDSGIAGAESISEWVDVVACNVTNSATPIDPPNTVFHFVVLKN